MSNLQRSHGSRLLFDSTTGAFSGVVDRDGNEQRTQVRRRGGSVASYKVGREVIMSGGVAVSIQSGFRAKADIIAFRCGFRPGATATVYDNARWGITGNGMSDTPQQAIDSCANFDTSPSKGAINMNGAAVSAGNTIAIPAQKGTALPGARIMHDWVYQPVSAGQMVLERFRATVGGTIYPYAALGFSIDGTGSTANGYIHDYLTLTQFPVATWTDATLDKVTGDAHWGTTSTNATTNMAASIFEVMLADGSTQVLIGDFYGDSTSGGTCNLNAQAIDPMTSVCEALNLLVSGAHLASRAQSWSGVDQKQYYQHFLQQMIDSPPDFAVLQIQSQNDTDATFSSVKALVLAFLKATSDLGIERALHTGFPWFNSSLSQDNIRKANIAWIKTLGVPVIDADSIISDGASPARQKAGYNSNNGSHPTNNAAYSDINAAVFQPAVRSMLRNLDVKQA